MAISDGCHPKMALYLACLKDPTDCRRTNCNSLHEAFLIPKKVKWIHYGKQSFLKNQFFWDCLSGEANALVE